MRLRISRFSFGTENPVYGSTFAQSSKLHSSAISTPSTSRPYICKFSLGSGSIRNWSEDPQKRTAMESALSINYQCTESLRKRKIQSQVWNSALPPGRKSCWSNKFIKYKIVGRCGVWELTYKFCPYILVWMAYWTTICAWSKNSWRFGRKHLIITMLYTKWISRGQISWKSGPPPVLLAHEEE